MIRVGQPFVIEAEAMQVVTGKARVVGKRGFLARGIEFFGAVIDPAIVESVIAKAVGTITKTTRIAAMTNAKTYLVGRKTRPNETNLSRMQHPAQLASMPETQHIFTTRVLAPRLGSREASKMAK